MLQENAIIAASLAENNPSIFTNYYIRNEDGYRVTQSSQWYRGYKTHWISQGRPTSFDSSYGGIPFRVKANVSVTGEVEFVEDRGFIFLNWFTDFMRAPQTEKTVIGLAGTGKTAQVGMEAMWMCASRPHYKFLNISPSVYQSNLMAEAINERIPGTLFEKEFVDKIVMSPRAKIYFKNGSTAEFMNVEKNAKNIQSWWGDRINIDEAGLLSSLDGTGVEVLAGMMIGVASRLRGQRPDGQPRDGIISMISMAYGCDTLWERYDMGFLPETQKVYYSRLVTHKENPYLSDADVERQRRNVAKGQEEQWMNGVRPPVAGALFGASLQEGLYVDQDPTAVIERSNPGIVKYEEEPIKGHFYVLAGDPGTGEPPYRNAPVLNVWDITDFPVQPARMVAFNWLYGNGSYTPFTHNFERLALKYKVSGLYRGYDSTSNQKSIAELAWQSGEMTAIPLGFESAKKFMYLNAMQMLMGNGKIKIPKDIQGIKSQIAAYRLPDKTLTQDIVCALAMACYLMYPLFQSDYDEQTEEVVGTPSTAPSRYGRRGQLGSRYGSHNAAR